MKEILNITTGNPISLHVTLSRLGEAFPVEYAEGLQVNLMSQLGQRRALDFVVNNDGSIDVSVPVISRPKPYGVEIRGTLNDLPWRTYSGLVLNYTNATVPGPSEVTVEGDSYDITMEVQMNAPADGPAAIEAHNNNEAAHPFILNLINAQKSNVVEWEGNYVEDEQTGDYIPVIPDHTYSELLELSAQGTLILLHFKEDDDILSTFVAVGGASPGLFVRVELQSFISLRTLTLHTLAPLRGDNDTIRLEQNSSIDLLSVIPTELSQLNDDLLHRTVTDGEKYAWNHKLGASELSQPTVTALKEWVAAQQFLTQQVNPDWNAESGAAKILNKPTIPAAVVFYSGIFGEENDKVVLVNDNNGSVTIIHSYGGEEGTVNWDHAGDNALGTIGFLKPHIEEKYKKPSSGIPATDLASAVRASLGRADSALQNETDPTVPSWAKQSSKPSYTAQEVGALPANTPLFSGSYNDLSDKPTIPDVSGKADKVVVVDASTLPASLDPNKVYQLGTLSGSVTIPPFTAVPAGDTEAKIWYFTFDTLATAPTITWPAAVTGWVGGSAPTINASKRYEVSVLNGIGAIMEI